MRKNPITLYLAAAASISALLFVFLICAGIQRWNHEAWHPGIESDALLSSVGLAVGLILVGFLLCLGLGPRHQKNRLISFTSHYQKISLPREKIEYVESLNEFVRVHTIDGTVYPTKVSITQWQKWLGPGFLRIHRSFLVNRHVIRSINGNNLQIESTSLPVSRNYKSDVLKATKQRDCF